MATGLDLKSTKIKPLKMMRSKFKAADFHQILAS